MITLAAAEPLNVTGIVMGLLGGLALFLYGMHKLSDGLKAVAGDGMRTLLAKLTTNRFTAAVTGALVTAVQRSALSVVHRRRTVRGALLPPRALRDASL